MAKLKPKPTHVLLPGKRPALGWLRDENGQVPFELTTTTPLEGTVTGDVVSWCCPIGRSFRPTEVPVGAPAGVVKVSVVACASDCVDL